MAQYGGVMAQFGCVVAQYGVCWLSMEVSWLRCEVCWLGKKELLSTAPSRPEFRGSNPCWGLPQMGL